MYVNLKAEIVGQQLKNVEIARHIGLAPDDFSRRLNNARNRHFTLKQGIAIKKKFFPDLSVEYLFETDT